MLLDMMVLQMLQKLQIYLNQLWVIQLNESARNQMEALRNNKNVKELEVLQRQVNEDNKYLIESK